MSSAASDEAVESIMVLTRMLYAVCAQMEENIGTPFTETVLKNAQAKMQPGDRSILLWWMGHKLIDKQRKG